MKYVPRLTAPSLQDKHYYSNDNFYYRNGVGMNITPSNPKGGNCTAYAWGRLYEITGKKYDKLMGNAEQMYTTAVSAGLKVGNVPKLGSIVAWRQGNTMSSADGCGHVAVVEEIRPNGDLLLSMSAWNRVVFETIVVTKASGYKYADGYILQGFIYCGLDFSTKEEDIVRKNYIDILERAVDDSGFKTYTNALRSGWTEEQLRADLLKSNENVNDTKNWHKYWFIVRCYKVILGRFPENENVITMRLKYSKQEIFDAIWNSPEARSRRM